MDLAYIGKLMLSLTVFAPGVVLLTFLSFLGLVMLVEKARPRLRTQCVSPGVCGGGDRKNPAPGNIVSSFTEHLSSADVEEARPEDFANKVLKLHCKD